MGQKEISASHYEKNKEIYKERKRKRELEIRAYMNKRKDVPCLDCGIKYPPHVMDFDHRPGEVKTIDPAKIVKRGWSRARIDKELSSCDVVCSNCHRIRTHNRRASELW
jgi:hypothetical protein